MTPSLPDTLVEGRFQLLDVLGEGGMATVYRAYDQRLRRPLAIKILSPALAGRASLRQRFLHEAMTMCALEDRRVVRVVDSGEDGERAYIIMELVEGGSLLDRVRDHGPLPPRMAARVTLELCRVLQYAHEKKVIHRDIKPHNILLTKDGEIRVTDFGIAQAQHDGHQMTRTGAVMGTWGFMAPEQKVDARGVEKTADVYSVGATFWSLLRAETPPELFMADTEQAMMEGIPEELAAVIRRATRYRREERYQSMSEMADSLAALMPLLDEDPADAIPLVPPRPPRASAPEVPTLAQLGTDPQGEPPRLSGRSDVSSPRVGGSFPGPSAPPRPLPMPVAAVPSAPTIALDANATVDASAAGFTMVPGESPLSSPAGALRIDPPPAAPSAGAKWGLLVGLALAAGLALSLGAGWVLSNLHTAADGSAALTTEALPAAAPAGVGTPLPDAGGATLPSAPAAVGAAVPTAVPAAAPAGGGLPATPSASVPEEVLTVGSTTGAVAATPVPAAQGTATPPVGDPPAAAPEAVPEPAPVAETPSSPPASPPPEAAPPPPKPRIEHTPVDAATVGQEVTFAAQATPGAAVRLYYRPVGTTTWNSKVMVGRDGAYSVPFRVDASMTAGLEYYFEATSPSFGRILDGGHQSPFRLTVSP